MNKYELQQLRRRNAESKRQNAYELMMRRRYETMMHTIYNRAYGLRATMEGFERWYWSAEGRAAAGRIVDADYRYLGEENPNPCAWDTRTVWRGKKVK